MSILPPEIEACVHCGHEEVPRHQCTECGGIPDDIDMPWEKLDPNAVIKLNGRKRLTPNETHDDVRSITFEIEFKSGYARKAKFIRPEKTLDLLRDDGSLGDFLRGLLGGTP